MRSPARREGPAPRPGWCPQASFPHERLICADPELSARDLRLAEHWRAYRRTLQLSRASEAWHKSDYFARVKRCGADKACIVAQQNEQMRRYQEALGKR